MKSKKTFLLVLSMVILFKLSAQENEKKLFSDSSTIYIGIVNKIAYDNYYKIISVENLNNLQVKVFDTYIELSPYTKGLINVTFLTNRGKRIVVFDSKIKPLK